MDKAFFSLDFKCTFRLANRHTECAYDKSIEWVQFRIFMPCIALNHLWSAMFCSQTLSLCRSPIFSFSGTGTGSHSMCRLNLYDIAWDFVKPAQKWEENERAGNGVERIARDGVRRGGRSNNIRFLTLNCAICICNDLLQCIYRCARLLHSRVVCVLLPSLFLSLSCSASVWNCVHSMCVCFFSVLHTFIIKQLLNAKFRVHK